MGGKKPDRHSRQWAINQKCRDCIYDPHGGGGTWRQQVEACPSSTCALWDFRPKSKPHKSKISEETENEPENGSNASDREQERY